MILLIELKEYLNTLIDFKDKHIIKVLTGIRRCGKSTLFILFQNYLLNNGVNKEQIISINFEDIDYVERELYPLNSISDHNPKYLLTLDDDPPTSHNGIKQLNAIDWLLK